MITPTLSALRRDAGHIAHLIIDSVALTQGDVDAQSVLYNVDRTHSRNQFDIGNQRIAVSLREPSCEPVIEYRGSAAGRFVPVQFMQILNLCILGKSGDNAL